MATQIKIKNKDLGKFELVKHTIRQDIQKHYTIEELAVLSELNSFKLKMGFKKLYGTTIYEFLRDERMKRGLHLLSHTDDTVQNIANLCGYGYATNFISVFHRKFKITPLDYRKGQMINRTILPNTSQYCFNDTPVTLSLFQRL
jgi:AraC family transcriptional activator of pyochelin receptor